MRGLTQFLRLVPVHATAEIRVSPFIAEIARLAVPDAFARLESSPAGLGGEDARARLEKHGRNELAAEKRGSRLSLLMHAVVNPLVILLVVLATVSFATGDPRAGGVMSLMIVLGVVLRLVQEARADTAAARLRAMITVTATAVRDGRPCETHLADLVPGDVITLSAGDMIPADVRVTSSKDLFIIQSSLTGESMPVEKTDTPFPGATASLELPNICFMGTSVERGTATAVVAATGVNTYIGSMSRAIVATPVRTSFDRGIDRLTWLMIRFILVLTPLVFLINGVTKHDWHDAFFFALAVAVGLTPEMLPMIVTVCLSKGAIAMSRKKVIVKRLNSIQNFGAMDVLCTDKTGTLTLDRVIIEKHCDVVGREDDDVMAMAYINSYFQTGLKNVLDRAVLAHHEVHAEMRVPDWKKVDEIPFDFNRRLMSVVVETPTGERRLVTKGAPEEVFKRCSHFELEGETDDMEPVLIEDLRDEYRSLSEDGFRVLAIAYRELPEKPSYSTDDEKDLVLRGYLAFLDPPKESSRAAIEDLRRHGVTAKVLTGDNELVTKKICLEVGLPAEKMLLGSEVDAMSDAALGSAAESISLFARLSPAHKQRIIRVLQGKGHTVGFLGDGINDAPALRAADIGVSVDTAVDIARESADVILLEKSLLVLGEGVIEGRKVFANILKYVRMGASSNFGNMASVLGASVFLPFLPMAPVQILTNNLLYDFSQVPIPTDEVDPDQVARPCPWDIGAITRFILFIGPLSSVFDYTTYFMMLYVFGAWDNPSLFQTGWFVESLLTQTLIIHIIRTNRIPFVESRASWPLAATTVAIMAFGVWLPFSPLAPALGFAPLPPLYWLLIIVTLFCYAALTHTVKMWLFGRHRGPA